MNSRRVVLVLPMIIMLAVLFIAQCRISAQAEIMPVPIEKETDVARLLTLLKAKNSQTREEAAQRLGELKVRPGFDPRWCCCKIMTSLSVKRRRGHWRRSAIPGLSSRSSPHCKSRKTEQGKETMLYALGAFKTPRAMEGVLWALQAPEPNARYTAASLLADTFWAKDVDALIKALQHNVLEMRMAGRRTSLGMLGDPRAIEPLIAAIHAYDKEPNWEAAVLGHDGNFGDAAFEPLLAALQQTQYPEKRVGAAWALSECQNPRVIQPMLAALDAADPLLSQKAAEALSLTFSTEPQVADKLLPLLNDPDRRMRTNGSISGLEPG